MDEFISVLNKFPNGTELFVEFEENVRIKAVIDTMYETDNGLELEDENYEEFYACLLEIISIEKNSSNTELIEGALLELTKYNKPSNIFLSNGEQIWKGFWIGL